jgi:protein-S-isoprenylcysteine O-methyltransferase Ste14
MVGTSKIAKIIYQFLTLTLTLTFHPMRPVVYMSFAFALSEFLLMLIKRSDSTTSKTRKDRGSLIFLWLMITTGFTFGFILSKPVNLFWTAFGMPLIIGGLIIRWIAILQLGNSFTVDVAITNTAGLKTDGIYERIRHPSYSGILMVVVGFSAIMSSLYSFLVFVIPVLAAIIYRISIEEKVLMSEFGENYHVYMANTKKLIPWVY